MTASTTATKRGQPPPTASTTGPDRVEISRQNGRKSRGPRTQEGKKRSRFNALKHGMTARMPLLPGEDEAEFRRQVDDFIEALQPRDAVELALAEQAAISLWKIERAERAEAARVAAALRAADAADGTENQDEVAAMGHWLLADTLRGRQNAAASLFPFLSEDRRDPFRRGRGDPRHIVLRLEASAEGCRWLLDQWARLARRLERGSDWRTNELIVALQLRGQRPLGLDLLEWERLLEPAPDGGQPELVAQARRGLLIQLEEGLPNDPAERRAALLGLVHEEAARLEQREAGHERREAADRAELADRLAVDTTPEGERMRRYQLDFDRKLHRALNGLLKLRRDEALGVAGDPAPDDDPARMHEEPAGSASRAPGTLVEPERGPVDDPEGETDGDAEVQPRAEGDSFLGEDPPAGGLLSAFRLPPSAIPEAAEPALAGIAAPARPAAAPESLRGPRNEPTPPAAGDEISRNEPSPPAGDDPASPVRRVLLGIGLREGEAPSGPLGDTGSHGGSPSRGNSSPFLCGEVLRGGRRVGGFDRLEWSGGTGGRRAAPWSWRASGACGILHEHEGFPGPRRESSRRPCLDDDRHIRAFGRQPSAFRRGGTLR